MKSLVTLKCMMMAALLCMTGIAGALVSDPFDAYPGGGTEWGGVLPEWTQAGTTAVQTVGIADTNPLTADGGSYLTYTTNTTGTTGLARDFAGTIGDSAYTATFTVRIDSLGTFFAGSSLTNDRLQLRGETSNSATTGITSQSASGAWFFTASPGLDADNWYVYDGGVAGYVGGYNRLNFMDSGIAVVEGGVYTFTVKVTDLASNLYDATITDGTTTFTYTGARYRTASASPADRIVFSNNIRTGSLPIQMSIDSIQIVPEPASLALLALGSLTLLNRRKK